MSILEGGFDEVVLATGGTANHTELPVSDTDVTICTSSQVLLGRGHPGTGRSWWSAAPISAVPPPIIWSGGSISAEQLYFLAAWGGPMGGWKGCWAGATAG